MQIKKIKFESQYGKAVASFECSWGNVSKQITFEIESPPDCLIPNPGMDFALVGCLQMAMVIHESLTFNSPMDPVLVTNLNHLQQRLLLREPQYRKKLQPILLDGPVDIYRVEERDFLKYGCFFSGGVDSAYSVVSNPEITDLIYNVGQDVSRGSKKSISKHVKLAFPEKRIHFVRTNLSVLLTGVGWNLLAHGFFLATVAQLFSRYFPQIGFSSCAGVLGDVRGTHPEQDYLFSSSKMRVLHLGLADRLDKLRILASSEIGRKALKYLTVCYQPAIKGDSSYLNCSCCNKCLRTMACIETLGIQQLVPTFKHNGRAMDNYWGPILKALGPEAKILSVQDMPSIFHYCGEYAPEGVIMRSIKKLESNALRGFPNSDRLTFILSGSLRVSWKKTFKKLDLTLTDWWRLVDVLNRKGLFDV